MERKIVSGRWIWRSVAVLSALLVAALVITACSSMNGNLSSGMATVKTTISDPATCQAPDGPYSAVWVTITDVQANVSSSAGDNDSGWADLTPNLAKNPKQVNLLGQANPQCFLASLGDAQELQAGTYQQIRVILADNSLSVSGNVCGNSANCVMLTSDPTTPHTLQLSSEAKTGLKIPSGQIAGGGFTIKAGETKDLNIDFNTCLSILREGNGQFRLKPVLHAGEVSTTSSSINGKVLDQATGNAVDGDVTVTLEQKDLSNSALDRIYMTAPVNPDGTFVFCPLPAGTYDVVVVGTRKSDGAMYAPSIVTGVTTGQTTGTINLYMPAAGTAATATLTGVVTSQTASNTATQADVALSAWETVGSTTFTIPLPPTSTQTATTLGVETAASTGTLTCPNNTDCASYTMVLPAGGAYSSAWSASGPTLTASTPLATYQVDGIATLLAGGTDCTPGELQSTPASALSGTGPFNVTVPTIPFTSCQ